jgi:hypothetical protein
MVIFVKTDNAIFVLDDYCFRFDDEMNPVISGSKALQDMQYGRMLNLESFNTAHNGYVSRNQHNVILMRPATYHESLWLDIMCLDRRSYYLDNIKAFMADSPAQSRDVLLERKNFINLVVREHYTYYGEEITTEDNLSIDQVLEALKYIKSEFT